jgi:uncharacterized protein
VTGVGGFSSATVAWFDPEAQTYREIAVAKQVELLATIGDVAEQDGKSVTHAHVVLGPAKGVLAAVISSPRTCGPPSC